MTSADPVPATSPPDAPAVLSGWDEVLARATWLLARPGRTLLGIAGPPGAGKSTLATRLERALLDRHGRHPPLVAQAPMDGFHLADDVLRRRGLRERKGAPPTFDVDAYAALLDRIRTRSTSELAAPSFDRRLDEPVPGTHRVAPETRLVIGEGNYLLLTTGGWERVRRLFDETWLLATDLTELRPRLVARWVAAGASPAEAQARVDGNDLVNAITVRDESGEPDFLVRLSSAGPWDRGTVGPRDRLST